MSFGLVSKSVTLNDPVSYTHLRAHETGRNLVCRLLLEQCLVMGDETEQRNLSG